MTGTQKDWDKYNTIWVDYQTKEWYIVANILKYGSNNLIVFYFCIYSRLLGTIEVVI